MRRTVHCSRLIAMLNRVLVYLDAVGWEIFQCKNTAIARRRKCLRGRAPGEAGRPRKVTVLKMHNY